MTDILGSLSPERLAHFWSRAQFNPGSDKGCLEWTASLNTDGYPSVWLAGALHSAHKLVHIHYNGPIPPGNIAAHTCNNRACILPAHLTAQTRRERTATMLMRGRKGAHGLRLTEAEEADIVAMSEKLKMSQQLLASTYGVYRGTILKALRRAKAKREVEAATVA